MEATDRGGNTPLHLAAMNGYVDAVRFLIQAIWAKTVSDPGPIILM